MRGKVLVVVAALVLGGIAAFATYSYLGQMQRQTAAGNELVRVYVAKQDLERGALASDLIAQGLVEQVDMPKRYVPDGAVSSTDSVGDRVLSGPVSKGEILTAGRLQYASEAGLAFSVPKDYVALTVPVDDARGVGGMVSPGDRVAVLATVQKTSMRDQETRIIVPGVQVLALGNHAGGQSQGASSGQSGGLLSSQASGSANAGSTTIVTLAVSAAEAEKIVFAVESGSIWLALLPGTSSTVKRGPGQTAATVFR